MDEERLPRKMLTSWVKEKRPRGAPEFTYGRGVYKAMKKVNLERNNWYQTAMDRDKWRTVISSC